MTELVVLVGVVVVGVALMLVSDPGGSTLPSAQPGLAQPGEDRDNAEASSSTGPAADEGTPGPSEDVVEPESGTDAAAVPTTSVPELAASPVWRPVVDGFAADFARPGPDWAERVSQWVSGYLAVQYRQLDQSRVPVAEVASIDVLAEGAYTVETAVSYDTGLRLAVRVELDPTTGWKVTTVVPVA